MRSHRPALLLVLCLLVSLSAHAETLKRRALFGAQVMPAPEGVMIGHVTAGTPADAAGLREGDVVTSLAGRAVADPGQFIGVLKSLGAGATEIKFRREGEVMTRALQLIEPPRETSPDYDVIYDSVPVDGALRRTIITRPRMEGRRPAVLFVGGIGCYSLDNPPPAVSGYIALIQELTRRGFVVMRVEKTSMGDSQGPPCQMQDFAMELRGYREGFRKLATYDYVDPANVFVVGHSIGGLVAPLLAGELPVRGVVAMSTAGQKWFDYEKVNSKRQLAMEGKSGDELAQQLALKEGCARKLMIEKRATDAIVAEEPACAEYLKYPAHYTYIQQVADLDPATMWKRVSAPVLLVHGTSDFVTDAEEHERIVKAVNAAHPGNATLLLEKNMDHFMRDVPSMQASMEGLKGGKLEAEPLQTQVRDDIATWLAKHVKQAAEKTHA
jgi:alpha-beta hydrolase superfamily lysophospholipase